MFKHCFMATLIGLLVVACAQKQNTIQPVTLQKSCQTPIIAYQLENIKIGEFNDLQIPKKQVLSLIENALQDSGCFIKAKQNTPNIYILESIYGSINQQAKQGGFWKSTSHDTAIIEVLLAFSNDKETRYYKSKASFKNTTDKFLGIGNDSNLNPPHIQLALNNAIYSAINQATQDFIKQK